MKSLRMSSLAQKALKAVSDAFLGSKKKEVQYTYNDTKTSSVIVRHIESQPVERGSADIRKWRTALAQAESMSQNRAQLYDLYRDTVLLDAVAIAVRNKRVYRMQNTNFRFVKNSKIDDTITALTNTTRFIQLIEHLVDSEFWGHSLIELINWDKPNGETVLIPRDHVRPRYQIVTQSRHDLSGWEYTKFPNIVEVGRAECLGLYCAVTPLVLWKRASLGDWAEFAESFGIPPIVAKYDNPETRVALQKAIKDMGARGRITIPMDAQMEVFNTGNASGSADLFDKFKDALNKEIAITCLGNSMTTLEATRSGQAQGTVQGGDQDELHLRDRAFVLAILNEKLSPILANFGFDTGGGHFEYDADEKLNTAQRIDRDVKLYTILGERIDPRYFEEIYKIPLLSYEPPKEPAKGYDPNTENDDTKTARKEARKEAQGEKKK